MPSDQRSKFVAYCLIFGRERRADRDGQEQKLSFIASGPSIREKPANGGGLS
jgi:hypothetical protein